MNWRHPGRLGATLYAAAAAVLGGVVAVVARLQIAGARGRADAVRRLPDGPVIVISNHTSYADGVLLALVCRRLGRSARLMATSGVFRAPLLGAMVRRLGFIPVERGSTTAADALDAAAQALAAGELVALFPEGRLTRDPDQWPERGKTGAVRLALRTGAPIVPVALVGAHRVVGRRGLVSGLIANVLLRPKVNSAVGEAIDVRGLLEAAETHGAETPGAETPETVRRLTDIVMERLVDLVEHLRGETAPSDSGAISAED